MIEFGSVCSGIEAAQLAFEPFGFKQAWSSEIAMFPSKVLEHHYPEVPNLGDMTLLPEMIREKKVSAPDLFCGGTPCQAFSLAGWKNGLLDARGQLTITFIDIANAIDEVRLESGKARSVVLWENVEGVLNDRTNAFGSFIAGLAGLSEEIICKKWPKSGFLEGPERNVAWRVLDAKYFGLPQQRKRLYVIAGGKDFNVDSILFEISDKDITKQYTKKIARKKISQPSLFVQEPQIEYNENLVFYKGQDKFEFFREYTDCLYAAYGTKWNGNAAAYNGSLYVAQNDRLRRLTPLECERLMGIRDNHTKVDGHKHTTRYQAVGNSWAVPVVEWLGSKINQQISSTPSNEDWKTKGRAHANVTSENYKLYLLNGIDQLGESFYLNSSVIPNQPTHGSLFDIIDTQAPEQLYLSQQACRGILRRKEERNLSMNLRLEQLLNQIAYSEIEYAGS